MQKIENPAAGDGWVPGDLVELAGSDAPKNSHHLELFQGESDLATSLQAAADRIRHLHRQTIGNIVAVGNELTIIKRWLGHGQFGGWLKAEFGWSDRTARRYMLAAAWRTGKSDIVSDLEPTSIYLLSSPETPEAAAQDVIDRLERGERLTAKGVRDVIATLRPKRRRKPAPPISPRQAAKQDREMADEAAKRETSGNAATKIANMMAQQVSDKRVVADLLTATTSWDLWTALNRAFAKPITIDGDLQ